MIARRSFLLLLWAVAVATLPAGCARQQIVTVPREVKVPVPVPCVDPEKRPARPHLYRRDDLLAMDEYRRTIAVWTDLRKREAYEAELEAVVEGCSRITPQPPH